MNRLRRFMAILPILVLMLITSTDALAVLKAVGPADPVSTLPKYYLDTNNLALQVCLDQNGMCLLPGGAPPIAPNFDPAFTPLVPITTTAPVNDGNFPDESFYYSAQALMNIETSNELANLAFVVEAAFLSGVAPDAWITFLRTDLQKMQNLTPSSTYRVTHPYGTFNFTTDTLGATTGGGGVAVRLEDGPAVPVQPLPPGMKAGTITGIGPYLVPKIGGFINQTVNGEIHTYIGDGTPIEVTGSPTGNNFFRVERLDAFGVPVPGAVWETNLFALNGRVYTGPIPSELSFTATYARDNNSSQVDIFATALPGAVLNLSGTGITTTPLDPAIPQVGKYFLHIPSNSSTLPTGLTITNSLDLQSTPPHPVTLVDEIIVTQAIYVPTTRELRVTAYSRDRVAPPTLSLQGFAGSILNAEGKVIVALPVGAIPPTSINVTSSYGGFKSVPISVLVPPAPPVAVTDSAITLEGNAVTINVTANDTTDASLDLNSVVIVTNPASGATAVPTALGSVLYTPPGAFTGADSFTYNVKDIYGQVSNTVTVNVIVHAPPVAGNDNVDAIVNQITNIDVIANDSAFSSSINSTTVNIVSAATCGSTAVLPNGTVNFTAPASIPAGPGTCTFSYVVSDTFVPVAISNVATVTATIKPPPAPVANNDSVTTTHGVPVIINVVGNDTSPISTINPATLAINATTGGTAAANLDGTVTYTPPATSGTYTFTYTVKDNAAPALASNVATVTVTVTAPDPATGTTFTPNIPTPQPIGALVLFTAQGQGGTGSYEYEFWRHNGTSWSKVQAYSSANSWLWNTAATATGTYTLQVNVRSAGSAAAFEATSSMFYTVDPVPTPPVAVNDPATTPVGTPVTINVITNDTSASSTINPATVAVSAPTGGTATANSNGTVTYIPPATPGTYTFAYTVKDNATTPLTSNVATVTVTVTAAPIVASATLTALPPAPQAVGSSIAVIATASGGLGSYEYEFLLHNGVSWSTKQAYSSKSTWTWDTTGLNPALCTIEVHVRNSGSTAPYEAIKAITYQLVAAPTAPAATTGATLSVVPGGPKFPGSAVVFAAGGVGGSGTYEYEFWLHNGVTWSKVQSYSAANTFGWDTTGLPTATYTVEVHVRSAGSTAAYEAITAMTYQLVNAATGATLTPNPVSPVTEGTSVNFTATGIGGSGIYEYSFWRHDGTTWTNIQPFSTNDIWTWDTTGATKTTYTIEVHVRSAGSSSTSEAFKGIFYTVQ